MLIPACNVWNFDETGTKVQYARTFLYGLCGSQGNQAEMNGAGEHVTIGATFVGSQFLFVGAQSSKNKLISQLREAGFENPLVLMKKGKASMDDTLFTEYLEWFASEVQRKGYTGQHILMIDNHDSHERSRPIETAMRNDIFIIFAFPSHCTHLVEMLDVSFSSPLNHTTKKCARSGSILNACRQSRTYRRLYYSSNCFIVLGVEHVSLLCLRMDGLEWVSRHVPQLAW